MSDPRNPSPTVDIIIEVDERIVWIERRNEPHGWALPGGFVDRGESVEHAAMREAAEETGLIVELGELLYVYSRPGRDPRQHNMSVVFTATADATPSGGDDARRARLFAIDRPPSNLVFDHREIFDDYLEFKASGRRPNPASYLRRHDELRD